MATRCRNEGVYQNEVFRTVSGLIICMFGEPCSNSKTPGVVYLQGVSISQLSEKDSRNSGFQKLQHLLFCLNLISYLFKHYVSAQFRYQWEAEWIQFGNAGIFNPCSSSAHEPNLHQRGGGGRGSLYRLFTQIILKKFRVPMALGPNVPPNHMAALDAVMK